MELAFALAAAVLYGSADFLGGAASRRSRAQSVLVVSAPAGAIALLASALVMGGAFRTSGLAWALAGGTAGGAGLIVFYGGLAAGPMSVVAPVSALVSTVLPVGVALAFGERSGPPVYAGAAICVLAIALVSMDGGAARPDGVGTAPAAVGRRGRPHATARGLGYGVTSGLAFGIFFLFMRNAGASGVLWPACAARVAGTLVILGAAAWLRTPPAGWGSGLAGRRVLLVALAAGVLDAAANACYILATRAGLFGIAVVITSLYPGITVLLARVMLGERMRLVQRLGLLLAAAGVALVTF